MCAIFTNFVAEETANLDFAYEESLDLYIPIDNLHTIAQRSYVSNR